MATYVALLRGVNVGGNRIVKMETLRAKLTAARFGNVRTYIQSGNVLVDSALPAAKVAASIAAVIEKGFGFPVTVVVRKPSELARALDEMPFPKKDEKRCYLSFLAGKAAKGAAEALSAVAGAEPFELVGKTLYVCYKVSPAKTKFTPALFDRILGVESTARNCNTVRTLIELAKA